LLSISAGLDIHKKEKKTVRKKIVIGDLLGHGDETSMFRNDRFVKPLKRLRRNPILIPEQPMGQ